MVYNPNSITQIFQGFQDNIAKDINAIGAKYLSQIQNIFPNQASQQQATQPIAQSPLDALLATKDPIEKEYYDAYYAACYEKHLLRSMLIEYEPRFRNNLEALSACANELQIGCASYKTQKLVEENLKAKQKNHKNGKQDGADSGSGS